MHGARLKPFTLFASCLPGLEGLLDQELEELGVGAREVLPGGVEFRGHARAALRVAVGSGIATRVLLRFERFRATRFETLRRRTSEIEWEHFLRDDEVFDVRADVAHCRLWHKGAVEERIALGILDRLGLDRLAIAAKLSERNRDDEGAGSNEHGDEDDEETLPVVRVRASGDRFGLALDLSGAPLWRRGYRQETAKAPLREDLAHALVRVALAGGPQTQGPVQGALQATAQTTAQSIVIGDPFCGSGTIGIEAAGIAAALPPGRARRFALERTVLDAHCDIARAIEEIAARRQPFEARILMSDRDAGAIEATRHNAARAGVLDRIEVACCAVSDAPLFADEGTTVIATNPPYGDRVGGEDLRALYQRFGSLVRGRTAPTSVALVTADARLARTMGLALESVVATEHGGKRVRFLRGVTPEPA